MLTDIVALFGAGVASFLAPCIIPLVPAYLGIIVGEMGDAHDPARAVPATLVFIETAPAVPFTRRDGSPGRINRSVDILKTGPPPPADTPLVVQISRWDRMKDMAGVMRGFVEHVDPSLDAHLLLCGPAVTGVARPYVVGVAFGAGWSPCVGPLLAAALTIAARSGGVGRGTILLAAYALGIGVPFLLAALGLASSPGLAERLRRVGPNLEKVAGILLVVLGVLLATNTYVHLTSYLARFVPAVHGL